ncbi:MAG: hypothetical protein ACI8R4_003995 [Paracoccaceae bacterium]|jgi:hypothetical protein
MLIFSQQSLAFIAVPKTGTTAIEMALKPKADILFTKRYKHMPARIFHTKVAPFLDISLGLHPQRFAVMRAPEEQVRSWFRYRSREQKDGSSNSTDGISFDAFVLALTSDDPPAFAKIGSQYNMLASGEGEVLVHHLFAYETPALLQTFLNDRFGQEIVLKQKNVSPPADAPLSDEMRTRLRALRAPEFELYDRLMDAGGHLQTQIG